MSEKFCPHPLAENAEAFKARVRTLDDRELDLMIAACTEMAGKRVLGARRRVGIALREAERRARGREKVFGPAREVGS